MEELAKPIINSYTFTNYSLMNNYHCNVVVVSGAQFLFFDRINAKISTKLLDFRKHKLRLENPFNQCKCHLSNEVLGTWAACSKRI
jgi:hypothetical protein